MSYEKSVATVSVIFSLLGCLAFAATAIAIAVLFYHPRIANRHIQYDNELEMNAFG